ncbi:MAG: methylmalonyl-CoA mutase subunit beta [Chloroflexi bacterium]|nr:methylmalonyl-CoA mutase subunit beta [Chloroflexota bacterium]
MTTANYSSLFAEFDRVSRDEWIAAIEKSLRGRSLDSLTKRSYEGIDLSPVATAEDLDGISGCHSLPGQYPYLRGTRAAGYRESPWLIAQELDVSDPGAFNQALHDALASGQTAVVLGSSPRIETIADLRIALSHIDLGQVPFFLVDGARALSVYQLFCAAVPEATLARLSGCIGYDPLGGLALTGAAPRDIFDRMAQHAMDVNQRSAQLGSIAVRSDVYHDAGASPVQELAIALSTGVTYLREMTARGLDVSQAAEKMHFFLSIGENFFMEIAKLRAIKMMWSQVARAFGAADEAQKIHLHARCGSRNKSQLDPHSNILRATSEAMAAAIAGVDSITVPPFDAPLGDSDAFSRRIARNLQLILQDELRLTELIDPAGGSWHVEKLTDQLAQAAWTMFQDIEAGGGLLAALQDGTIQAGIGVISKRRQRDLEAGDAVLVGVNAYLNPDETRPAPREGAQPPADDVSDASAITAPPLTPLRLAAPFESRRQPAGAGA